MAIKIGIGLGCLGIIWQGGWGVIPDRWFTQYWIYRRLC
jgi:hypothetical protein